MKRNLILLNFILFWFMGITAQPINVTSLDGKLKIEISIDSAIHGRIFYDNNFAFSISPIIMQLANGKILGQNPKLSKQEIKSIDRTLTIAVPTKASEVKDNGNELTMNFKDSYSLLFRVYNDGFAYRFKLNYPDTIIVVNEQAKFTFPDRSIVFFPEGTSFFLPF